MKPVYQTRFGGGNGNCLLACVASILHRPIESIPDFNLSGCGWMEELYEWCGNEGIGLIQFNHPHYGDTGLYRGHGIAVLSVVGSDEDHAVICEFVRKDANSESWAWESVPAFDPNPKGVDFDQLKHILVLIPSVSAGGGS